MRVSLFLASLTLLLLPAYVVRFQVGPLPSTLLEVLILVTVAVWNLENWRAGRRELFNRIKSPIFWPGLTLVLLALVEVWFSADHLSGLGEWRAYFLEPFLLGLVVTDLARRGRGKWLLLSLLGSGLWVAGIGIAQTAFHQFVYINPDSFLQLTFGRAISIYNTGNAVALYLGPLLPLAAGLTVSAAPYLVVAVLVFGLGLWGSKSHGGWAASVASLGVSGLGYAATFRERLNKLFWRVVPVMPIIAALGFLIFMLGLNNFTPTGRPTNGRIYDDTRILRLCLWQGTANIIKQNPLFGSGVAGFSEAYAKNYTCDRELLRYPHNIFLNFWVETGLAGLLTFLLIFWRSLRGLRESKDQLLALSLAGALLYLLFHGLVDVPYFKNDLAAEFWVIASLAVAAAENKFSFKN